MQIGALGDIHGEFDTVQLIMQRHADVPLWVCGRRRRQQRRRLLHAARAALLHQGQQRGLRRAGAGDQPAIRRRRRCTTCRTAARTWSARGASRRSAARSRRAGTTRRPRRCRRRRGARRRPASLKLGKSRDDKRRHFVRDEVLACKALPGSTVPHARSAAAVLPAGRRIDAGKTVLNDVLAGDAAAAPPVRPPPRVHRLGPSGRALDRPRRRDQVLSAGRRRDVQDRAARYMKPLPDSTQALDERVLVCDGAMGTMLYAKGVFINKSFDALNLTQPDLVAAGAPGVRRAPAPTSSRPTRSAPTASGSARSAWPISCTRSTRRARRSRAARRRASAARYVAGAIGPLGVRIEPWGKTGVDEAREYFREQAQALADGGVDLFILETFRDLNEIGAAIDAVRSVSDTADRRADDHRGGRQHARRHAAGAVRAGPRARAARRSSALNCAVGPAPMLDTIERMAAVTRAAAVGAAQRRPAARRRGAQHLSVLAGIHGVVRAALHPAQRPARRRLLRDDAGAHPADEARSSVARRLSAERARTLG